MTADLSLTAPWWNPPRRQRKSPRSAGSSWADVVDVDFGPFSDAPPIWVAEVATQLSNLTSEHGRRPVVSTTAVFAALNQLVNPIWSHGPRPSVSEAVDGGVVAEFKGATGTELQLEWNRAGDATIYVFDGSGFEWEGALGDVPEGLPRWAWRVGQSS